MPAAVLALTLTWPTLAPSLTPPPAWTTDAGAILSSPRRPRMGVEGDAKIHCIINYTGASLIELCRL